MSTREYGQFCGLARAAELLAQRWTLLILRDLLVGSRRYSDLAAGLPGISSNLLSTRLKELEHNGLIRREVHSGSNRSIVYALTQRGAELQPALDALSRWGAAGLRVPRQGEVITDAALASALRVAASGANTLSRRQTYTVRIGEAVAHALVDDGVVEVNTGGHPGSDLVLTGGQEFRDLLAGTLDSQTAISDGVIALEGDPALLADFMSIFVVPYSQADKT
ncbi:MAG: helix-turn-helix domain-containing protein [Aeromicrobium sp.]|uniref:winged helix-turn-helix transcriptional regulator n=1 Tax=Aeromicrobium sp. TaxID=1871063 RepID=UPI003C4A4913